MDVAMSPRSSLVFSLQNYYLAEHSSFSAFHLWKPMVGLSTLEEPYRQIAIASCLGNTVNQRAVISSTPAPAPAPTPAPLVFTPSWFFY